eukprot:gene52877-70695_t
MFSRQAHLEVKAKPLKAVATPCRGDFASYRTVNHSGKGYVRYEGDRVVRSNTSENVFS